MIPLALIRHGPTDWNEERRLQGHADRRLSPAGREKVSGWLVPDRLLAYEWFVSPLTRAGETASLLGLEARPEPSLIEMDWGHWEGATIHELRERYGADAVAERTSMGLDLRPHGGESPREVRDRVHVWARNTARRGRPVGAVAHQGIVRALLSLATGWEMIGEPPHELDWASAHIFEVDAQGNVAIGELNISLEAS